MSLSFPSFHKHPDPFLLSFYNDAHSKGFITIQIRPSLLIFIQSVHFGVNIFRSWRVIFCCFLSSIFLTLASDLLFCNLITSNLLVFIWMPSIHELALFAGSWFFHIKELIRRFFLSTGFLGYLSMLEWVHINLSYAAFMSKVA